MAEHMVPPNSEKQTSPSATPTPASCPRKKRASFCRWTPQRCSQVKADTSGAKLDHLDANDRGHLTKCTRRSCARCKYCRNAKDMCSVRVLHPHLHPHPHPPVTYNHPPSSIHHLIYIYINDCDEHEDDEGGDDDDGDDIVIMKEQRLP